MQRKAVMKHAKPETPLERADRLISELTAPEWFGNYPRHHATDNRWQERQELMNEFYSVPVRFMLGLNSQEFIDGMRVAGKELRRITPSAKQWEEACTK